jgi:hypothetical protein
MWLTFILSIFDLDGFEDAFEGTMTALELVLFVLAIFIAIGVVQVCVDRVKSKVKVRP